LGVALHAAATKQSRMKNVKKRKAKNEITNGICFKCFALNETTATTRRKFTFISMYVCLFALRQQKAKQNRGETREKKGIVNQRIPQID